MTARLLLQIRNVSLVNLLLGRRLVPELLQGQMTPGKIAAEVRRVWEAGPERDRVVEGLKTLRGILGTPGAASRAADQVLALLDGKSG